MNAVLATTRRVVLAFLVLGMLCLLPSQRVACPAAAQEEADPGEALLDQASALMPDAALTTSLADAYPHVPFLDTFDPQRLAPLARVPHSIGGYYPLLPGLWETQVHSYCLKAGTYAPEQGDGYLAAPLLGPQADILRKLLRSSLEHPGVTQNDIQEVVLAVVLRLEISQLPESSQSAARLLLSPEDLARIDGYAERRVGEFERLIRRRDASFSPGALPEGMSEPARAGSPLRAAYLRVAGGRPCHARAAEIGHQPGGSAPPGARPQSAVGRVVVPPRRQR
ncbi:MAG: hypothetical protein QHJ73_17940 [Armatimonadota bacterium]|nr:hypothetical protein [Armatimonadota bacterium]